MKAPLFTICHNRYEKMEFLNLHMKTVNQETDSMRMDRLAKTVKKVIIDERKEVRIDSTQISKSLDCSECGVMFKRNKDKNNHIKNDHEHKEDFTNVVKEEVIPDSEVDTDDLDYKIKYQPKGAEREKRTGIKFLGDSEEFNQGVRKLKELFKKDSKYSFEGCEVKISEDVKALKTLTVHVSTGNLKGTAGIKSFSFKESGESLTVTRQKGQAYALTDALATNFVKVILDTHLNNILNDDFVQQLEKHSIYKTIGKQEQIDKPSLCDECDYVAKNEHGLNIHKERKHTEAIEKVVPELQANEQKNSPSNEQSQEPSSFGSFICPMCGLRCQDERFFKYHISLRHDKFHPGEPTKIFECESCPKELTNDLELEAYMKHNEILRENIVKTPLPKYECDNCDYKL